MLIVATEMLLGTMQDDGLAAKPRATDFSIEAIMAKEPRPSLPVRPQFIAGQYTTLSYHLIGTHHFIQILIDQAIQLIGLFSYRP